MATFISGGTAGSSVAPVFTGGTAGTYSISTQLPAGITINSTTGVISWSGNITLNTYNIVVTNSAGGTFTYTLSVISNGSVGSFTYPTNSATFISGGTPGNSGTPTYTGKTPGTYSTVSPLAQGITINQTTGVISWTGNISSTDYIIVVTNTAGGTFTFTLHVNAGSTTGGSFSYSTNSATFVSGGTAASSVTPTYTGGTPSTYVTQSNLPTGVTLNPNNGVISWTGSVAVGTYTIIVRNNAGGSATFTLTVNPGGTQNTFSYTPSSATYVLKQTPEASNSGTPTYIGTPGTYSTTTTLPGFITLNSSTGVISWSGFEGVEIKSYAIVVNNSNGGTFTYTLNVVSQGFNYTNVDPNRDGITAIAGQAGSYGPPQTTGGFSSTGYSMVAQGGGSIPSGLTINPTTGVISWNTTITSGTNLVLDVTNNGVTETINFVCN